jgi:hypothetical protein
MGISERDSHPEPRNMTLFEKRIFADVIKLRMLRRDY